MRPLNKINFDWKLPQENEEEMYGGVGSSNGGVVGYDGIGAA